MKKYSLSMIAALLFSIGASAEKPSDLYIIEDVMVITDYRSQIVPIESLSKDGKTKKIGNIVISETPYGLLFTPDLKELPPGLHGFHIHENPNCGSAKKGGQLQLASKAGGHFDPEKTGIHLGPYDPRGHLGDLPALHINAEGIANYPVLAPRLKSLDQIENRSMMIHAGGDNHSDEPVVLGGGGVRIACGVIKV